ncbi:MAG TPA: response regulator [Devosia sp.]|nr:response regulator [Devosia sp.]
MLAGQTVLIVETEFLIALDIQRCLEAFGAAHTVFARNTTEALGAVKSWPSFGLALVEIHNGQDEDRALLQGLTQAGVKLVLLTADTAPCRSRASFPGQPVVLKPFLEEDLASAIRQALAN